MVRDGSAPDNCAGSVLDAVSKGHRYDIDVVFGEPLGRAVAGGG